MGVREPDPLAQLSLPPGFRFFPTDEELMVQYLCKKAAGHIFSLQIIAEIDLYKFDPWVLPSKAAFGEKEWYFFSPRDRKYPNGSRPNRVAGSGYWKATGTDKVITTAGRRVGVKKALVFYIGKAPKGTKTNWIMHEYRLIEPSRKNGSSKLDDWVLCRIYKKNSSSQKQVFDCLTGRDYINCSSDSCSTRLDDVLASQEIEVKNYNFPVMNPSNSVRNEEKTGFGSLGAPGFAWASGALRGPNSVAEIGENQAAPPSHTYYDSFVTGKMEEEVQSGFRNQRPDNSGMLTQCLGSNSVDPYGLRCPNQSGGYGFM